MKLNLFKIVLNLLIVVISIHYANNAAISGSQGLYSPEDDVNILTAETMKNEIYGSQRAWVVEFYNSWCGFCQRFAPSWKALGTDIKEWSDLIAVGAIDCSNDDNYPLCREFEVMAYPTLRYYHENLAEASKHFGVTLVPLGKDVNDHRHQIIDTIIDEQKLDRGKQYPNLLPYNNSDVSHVYDFVPSNINYIFLIMQDFSSYLAQEVSLDLHKSSGFIIRYAITNNTVLLNNLKVLQTPALVVVNRDKTFQHLSTDAPTREAFNLAISEFLKSKHVTAPETKKQPEIFTGKWMESNVSDMATFMREKEEKALAEKIKTMPNDVFQMDLETALRYSLTREVASNKQLTGEKLTAFKKYLDVLVKYFPFGKNGHKLLKDIQNYVNTAQVVKGLEIGMMVKKVEKPEQGVFSTPKKWLGCKGSTDTHRGYPCGLWKLFHYLTVSVAEDHEKFGDTNPKLALEAMHGYIKNFFSCADCSEHFQEMAARRELDKVSSFNDSIIWLWQAHNEVNNRLSGDITEDPEFPKVQFPLRKDCPQCRYSDDSWNIPEVLKYLKRVYRNTSVRYIGADTRVLDLVPSGGDSYTASDATGFFKVIDTSMCLVLYISSIILIIVLIHMFMRRTYRKKVYKHDLHGKI